MLEPIAKRSGLFFVWSLPTPVYKIIALESMNIGSIFIGMGNSPWAKVQ